MNIATAIPIADNWDMHGDFSAGWMIVMMVAMVLVWAVIIFGIVWLVRGATGGGWHWGGERKETPSDILERRFAEGAISVEDFHQRREVIAAVAHRRRETGGGDEPPAPGTSGREEA